MDVIGDVLPRSVLAAGFVLDGERVPLLGPQGIFKPRIMTEAPLSITTIPGRYNDGMGSGGVLSYAYRGTDPAHPDNRGLRRAMERQLPLVYFYRVLPGQYLAAFPVFIVGDHPSELAFDVAVDDPLALASTPQATSMVSEDRAAIRREYVTATVRRRVHQQAFRGRVIARPRSPRGALRSIHPVSDVMRHVKVFPLGVGQPILRQLPWNGMARG
jgi:putative restriction endonuclease